MLLIDGFEAFVIVTAAFVLGGLIKGMIGFGLPLITTPILSLFTSIPEAVALNMLPVLFANVFQIVETRRAVKVLMRIWPLLLTSFVLLFFGTAFPTALDKLFLQFVIGVLILTHLALEHRGFALRISRQAEPAALVAAGAISAGLGSVSSICMFPSIPLLHGMRLSREEFVMGVCVFLLGATFVLWLGLWNQGVPMATLLFDSLFCTIPLMIGTGAGTVLRNRVSQDLFRRYVVFGLICTGVVLIMRQLLAWLT